MRDTVHFLLGLLIVAMLGAVIFAIAVTPEKPQCPQGTVAYLNGATNTWACLAGAPPL